MAFLRNWNNQAANWLPPEDFEEKKAATREMYPQDYCPVMRLAGGKIDTQVMRWGLSRPWIKGPLINIRAETVAEKPAFREMLGNRCIVPADGFYEWRHEGKKITRKYMFTLPGTSKVYLAALYEEDPAGASRFAILTTEANSWMREVHDRMPVILRPDEAKAWLRGPTAGSRFFDRASIEMVKEPADSPAQLIQ